MAETPNYRKLIEDSRKAGSTLDWKFFKNADARKALYDLNKENEAAVQAGKNKNMSASDLANEEAKRRKLPHYKKGGKVKKTSLALVHKGERVLTKAQQVKHEMLEKSAKTMGKMYSK